MSEESEYLILSEYLSVLKDKAQTFRPLNPPGSQWERHPEVEEAMVRVMQAKSRLWGHIEARLRKEYGPSGTKEKS